MFKNHKVMTEKSGKSKVQVTQSIRQIDNGFIIRTEKSDGMRWSSTETYSKTNPLSKVKLK